MKAKQFFFNVARWIFLLPTSFALGILVLFPLHWGLYYALKQIIEPYPEMPERLLAPLITALTVVYSGAYIAPTAKKNTAIILAIVWIALAVYICLTKSIASLPYGGVSVIFGCLGAIIGVIMTHNDLNEKE